MEKVTYSEWTQAAALARGADKLEKESTTATTGKVPREVTRPPFFIDFFKKIWYNLEKLRLGELRLVITTERIIMAEEEAKNLEKTEVVEETTNTKEEVFAKSGKKSKKHIEEVKAEEERQARKAERAAEGSVEKPKGAKPITRPLSERRGKKYQEAAKLIEKGFLPVSLGSNIMRVETVPIYLLSVLNYEIME